MSKNVRLQRKPMKNKGRSPKFDLNFVMSMSNKPLKQYEVKKMVARLKVSIICLVETCVQKANIIKMRDNMLPGWEILHNCNDHWLGKIWICWDPGGFSINVVDVHEQVLTCKVNAIDNRGSWMMSIVYGANHGTDGRHLL
jgi:hypothetical protein